MEQELEHGVPELRPIEFSMLSEALRRGWADMKRSPGYSLLFASGYVLIGLSPPFQRGLRLADIAGRRQRGARILFLLDAKDQPLIRDMSRDYLIKEYVFSNLLELM